MKHIGILGGTFDPIHNAHIKLMLYSIRELELDELWVLPAPNPPHKIDRHITPIDMRIEMIRLAISSRNNIKLSDVELKRSGKSYTYQTILELINTFPLYRFYFIMGADSLYQLKTWKNPELIIRNCTLVVANREYNNVSDTQLRQHANMLEVKYGADIVFLNFSEIDISSSMIREHIINGKNASKYLPKKVHEYIVAHKLYKPATLTG